MIGEKLAKKFGDYGGQYVPETLMPALIELEDAYFIAKDDPDFQAELQDLLKNYVGRPTPLSFVKAVQRTSTLLPVSCGRGYSTGCSVTVLRYTPKGHDCKRSE